MKKYIAFDFDSNGYIKMCVLTGKTKYDVADKYYISRNNIYQYDLIVSMFKWLYNNNTINRYYFFKDNKNFLYLYNSNFDESKTVFNMVTIKKAIKASYNR